MRVGPGDVLLSRRRGRLQPDTQASASRVPPNEDPNSLPQPWLKSPNSGEHLGLSTKTRREGREGPSLSAMPPLTMYEKIWDAHLVRESPGEPSLIYIDRHLIHEGTSPQAFAGLKAAGRKVRRPDLTFAVMDHSVPTQGRNLPVLDTVAAAQFDAPAT